jgi:integrase
MPSVHRKPNSPYWHAAYYLPDGRRTQRSTGCRDKRKALQVAFEFQKATDRAKEGRLAEVQARQVIADIYAIANKEAFPNATVREHIASWLAVKALEVSSISEHERAAKDFLEYLGPKADKPIDSVQVKDITGWRAKLSKELSGATVNKLLKLVRGAFTHAMKLGLLRDNVFTRVDYVKKTDSLQRRALALEELKKVLAVASNEWRGLILFGVYTGQRLGDIAALTWAQVDLQTEQVTFTPRKTGKTRQVPIAAPVLVWLLEQKASDDPRAPVFETESTAPVHTLSHRFSALLADAGLQAPVSHHKTAKREEGNKRRKGGNLSFHCLRHTATSLLKNTGASDVIARELIGHASEAVSRVYTHIESNTLRRAVDALPDITK